ncbi:hypothetical protein MWU54_04745 [Marivita sp. S6314]|uniref:hypothetical protein n=1 Tax=Marivita sp. S6314 TaxID=2926406 RepID=UPI001FF18169|nr:hypothetical protein [Marivita sp. S6314]MCK0149320.1 hypothetical protein [Marivita sp. S6314]
MKKLKIVLLSSVLAIGLGQAAHAVYSQDDLTTLQNLVEAGDTQGVLAFINANPEVMVGIDPLAEALREFVASREGLFGGFFGPRVPEISGVPSLPDGVSSEDVFVSGSLSDFGS